MATATERAHRFTDIAFDPRRLVRPGEANEARPVGKTEIQHVAQPRRKGAPRAAPLRAGENHRMPARAVFARAARASEMQGADHTAAGARQAQLQLAEENLALRMRIRQIEGL